MLEALERKGYLIFRRSPRDGFFIRLVEHGGSAEILVEVPILGRVDRYGEVHDFLTLVGHFPMAFQGSSQGQVFALELAHHLPQASMLAHDRVVFNTQKPPQAGDICLGLLGKRPFLIRIASRAFDKDTPAIEVAQEYPLPGSLLGEAQEERLHWYPLAYDEDTADRFERLAEEADAYVGPIPPEVLLGTALTLVRRLAL